MTYQSPPPQDNFGAYSQQPTQQPKSKIAAALLAFFLGSFGVHNFYLGYTSRAIWQLGLYCFGWATSFFVIGIPFVIAVQIWAFVEFVLILLGASIFDRDARGVPLAN